MARSSFAPPEFLNIFRALPGHHLFLQPDAPAFSIVEISDEFGAALKMERQHLLGKSIFELLPDHINGNAQEAATLKASLLKALTEKVPQEMPVQKRVVRVNGTGKPEERYWLSKNIPVLDEAGNVTYLLHSAADITHAQAPREIGTCRELFEHFARTSQEGFWHLNLATNEVTRFGTGFYSVFGSNLMAASTPDAWEDLIHPDDRSNVKNHFRTALETPGVDQTEETYQVQKADGSYAAVLESVYIIRNPNGTATEVYGKATDITHRKKNDIEKELQISELLKNNFELKQFSFSISHNLRTPLANLIGLGTLINENQIEDPFMRQALEKYKQATLQLSKNVENLFQTLTRKNNREPEVEPVALDEVFKQVAASIETSITGCGAEITTDFSAGNVVEYLPGYLHSVFLNLLTNAIKYRSPERKLQIKVATERKDNVLFLHVTDNGLGIDLRKYGDKIFGLYQKFHNHPESTGVGLHLVATQVKAMGGRIWVTSEPDRGSTFTIQFKN